LTGTTAVDSPNKHNYGGKAALQTRWSTWLHLFAILKQMLATKVQELPLTPPSTTVVTPAKQVGGRRGHQSKHRDNRGHVTTRRSIDWNMVAVILCTHDPTSFLKVVQTTRVLTRTVTYLIVRRVTLC
jgi:hypothetical protein